MLLTVVGLLYSMVYIFCLAFRFRKTRFEVIPNKLLGKKSILRYIIISSMFQSENLSLAQLDGDMIGLATLQSRYLPKKQVLLITMMKIKFYTDDFYRSGLYVR